MKLKPVDTIPNKEKIEHKSRHSLHDDIYGFQFGNHKIVEINYKEFGFKDAVSCYKSFWASVSYHDDLTNVVVVKRGEKVFLKQKNSSKTAKMVNMMLKQNI